MNEYADSKTLTDVPYCTWRHCVMHVIQGAIWRISVWAQAGMGNGNAFCESPAGFAV
jgi:hypothetical protein